MTPLWALWVLFALLLMLMMGAGLSDMDRQSSTPGAVTRRMILQRSLLVLAALVLVAILTQNVILAVTL